MLKRFGKAVSAVVVAAGALALPAVVWAQQAGPDYSAIEDAINWDAVGPILIAAGGALALVMVLRKGVKLALSMLK